MIHHAILYRKHLIGSSLISQHGNDPKHSTNALKTCLDRKTHCNTSEAAWDHLENGTKSSQRS